MTKTKTPKTKTPRKTQKKGHTKTKKTEDLVYQIIQLRKQRYNYFQISRQLGVDPKAVKKWYYEAINVASPEERKHMRSEETELNEDVIRGCRRELGEVVEPVQPDWGLYEGNLVARASAYGAWLAAVDRVFDKRMKAYSLMLRASRNIVDINGLQAPTRVEVDHKDSGVGLDEEIRLLVAEMEARGANKS